MRRLPRFLRRSVAVLAVMGVAGAVSVATSSPDHQRVLAAEVLGAGGEFHPLTPQRVLDTRTGFNTNAPGAKPAATGAGSSFEVDLSSQGGLPQMDTPEDPVLAVVVSITVVEPTQPGYLRAFGSGNEEGTSSVVNFGVGETVPNLTILSPGTDGTITVRLVSESANAGSAHVLIDTFGWFSKGTYETNGSRLIPVGPGRIFDSRNPAFGPQPIGAGQSVEVPIHGADSLNPPIADIVPDRAGISGAVLNITAVNQGPSSAPTFVSVVPERPAAGTAPTTSNLNLRPGQVKANLVVAPVGADGSVWLYNSAGNVDLVVDVVAYLEPRPEETREGRVIPLDQPFRVLDTRQQEFGNLQLGPGMAEEWRFCNFVADVRIGSEWVGRQSAFFGNLTATGLTRPDDYFTPVDTYLTVYPSPAPDDGGPPPEASNLNLLENQSVPNAALFRYGPGPTPGDPTYVTVYNYNGYVHYLVDAAAVVLADGPDEPLDCADAGDDS